MKPTPILLGVFLFFATDALTEENWSQFRGPTGRGHSADSNVPTEWSADSVVWKSKFKGAGQSSPVNWGDRIFLTSSSANGEERYLFCLSRSDGKVLWEKTIHCSNPESAHRMNSLATPTCAVNESLVVAFFGPAGLWCFDHEGNEKWNLDLGEFPGDWGVAASPIIVGSHVFQNCDRVGPSKLVAVNLANGKISWSVDREEKPRGGWSTPIVIDAEGTTEMVLNGEFGVRGYDLSNGKEKWFCEAFNGRGTPVPDFALGKLYVVNGKPGDTYAVAPGGRGDVTRSRMVWHAQRKGGRDLPSPAVVGSYLVVSSMSGVATCYDAETGDVWWTERLAGEGEGAPRQGIEVAASPLVANGLIYFQNVFGGEVYVVKPGKKRNVVAVNQIGGEASEVFRSTMAPVRGQLFIRSYTVPKEGDAFSTLYCVE